MCFCSDDSWLIGGCSSHQASKHTRSESPFIFNRLVFGHSRRKCFYVHEKEGVGKERLFWAQLSGDGGGFGQSRSLDRFNMSETVLDPVGQVRGFQAFTVHDVFTFYFIYYPFQRLTSQNLNSVQSQFGSSLFKSEIKRIVLSYL